MLSVFETGEDTFRLSNSKDEEVGWVRAGALGFTGFPDESTATEAALRGSDALTAYLERLSGSSEPVESSSGRVKIVHDGAYEWITRGSVPLARLYRPDRDAAQRKRGSFAVEFVLPSYVRAGTVISAAQVVYHAVTRVSDAKNGAAAKARSTPAAAGKAFAAGAASTGMADSSVA